MDGEEVDEWMKGNDGGDEDGVRRGKGIKDQGGGMGRWGAQEERDRGEADQNKVNKLLITREYLEKETRQKSPLRTHKAEKHMPAGGGGGGGTINQA